MNADYAFQGKSGGWSLEVVRAFIRLRGESDYRRCRAPEILADSAYALCNLYHVYVTSLATLVKFTATGTITRYTWSWGDP